MNLLNKAITEQLHKNFPLGADMEQMVVTKFFDPTGSWSWYVMNMDMDNDYCWGIVKGFDIEMGSFSLKELEAFKGKLGIGIERDIHFKPIKALELWERLQKGEHV